ncbi:hypothetical protein [Rossellomorea marisflavi]|uniref:hypothetical protein n=1 Tax=Rossellomorea marisflavi TaxID=189381 RepID=UPI0009A87423|nr:hypothetical protein [Rossellomorea marisflavi]
MFFRKMTEEETRNSTKASGTAFSVLLIVLLGAFRLYVCKDVRDRGFIHDHAGGGGGVFWE